MFVCCCIFAYLAVVAQQRVYMPQYIKLCLKNLKGRNDFRDTGVDWRIVDLKRVKFYDVVCIRLAQGRNK
jgi:hypothetical protein